MFRRQKKYLLNLDISCISFSNFLILYSHIATNILTIMRPSKYNHIKDPPWRPTRAVDFSKRRLRQILIFYGLRGWCSILPILIISNLMMRCMKYLWDLKVIMTMFFHISWATNTGRLSTE